MWTLTESNNYIFHYRIGSYAESNICEIIDFQEICLNHICEVLEVNLDKKIEYFLCDTPEEVGLIYGDNEPCNGFASMPNQIYAVYNEKIKCIGYHEDVHIISYNTLARPPQNFIREGLAMYFDKKWWGVQNYEWVQYCLLNTILPSIYEITDGGCFHDFDEKIIYPFAGAFTDYIIKKYGIERYKKFYMQLDEDFSKCFESIYNTTINECENEFLDSIRNKVVNIEVHKSIEAMI